MVPPSSQRIPRVRWYSGYCRSSSRFIYVAITRSGSLSQVIWLRYLVAFTVLTPDVFLLPVWPLPLSLATTRGISFDFSSSGYLDVSVPRVPHVHLCVQCTFHDSSSWVFPHSDISGSKLICSSPKLFAACHVLHRLPMPRHSPYALSCLNYLFKSDLSFLKLFSLAWIAMSSYISHFTVTLAICFHFVWRNFSFCYLLY